MKEQRERARSSRKESDTNAWEGSANPFSNISATVFSGYDNTESDAEVLAIAADGELTGTANEGQTAVVVFNQTCFYAESGGQVGDTGLVTAKNGTVVLRVSDTKKDTKGLFLHSVTVEKGSISVGDNVKLKIDTVRRDAIRRNHTAAHLLQAGLRKVLGTHVEQAGQLVDEKKRCVFDFTHFSALTDEELSRAEGVC